MNLIFLSKMVFLCDFFFLSQLDNPTLSPCCIYQDFDMLLEVELPKMDYCPIGYNNLLGKTPSQGGSRTKGNFRSAGRF